MAGGLSCEVWSYVAGGLTGVQVNGSFGGTDRHLRPLESEGPMAATKLIVMYPPPTDVGAFERLYQEEHVPMAVKKLQGKTKIVATKIQSAPSGKSSFYRIAEIHFPSMEALQACAASAGGKETLAHAAKISSGGPPVVLIGEEQTFTF
jgi:uncharacterized protein (TIGR02118 family)